MLNTTGHSPLLRTFAALLATGQFLGGCAATRQMEERLAASETRNEALQEENRRLVNAVNEQKSAAARLQLELVRAQAETGAPQTVDPGASTREPATAQGRVPPPNSKAEAVICLAEAQGEISSAQEAAGPGTASADTVSPDWSVIDGLLADSRKALAEDRYDQACALAFQALHATREAQLRAVTKKVAKARSYADFAQPMPLVTRKPANLRGRASTGSRIQETLAAGTKVLATGYRGGWIKVISEKGQVGWVYYSLLEVKAPAGAGPRP